MQPKIIYRFRQETHVAITPRFPPCFPLRFQAFAGSRDDIMLNFNLIVKKYLGQFSSDFQKFSTILIQGV